jgi:hypothetical protein
MLLKRRQLLVLSSDLLAPERSKLTSLGADFASVRANDIKRFRMAFLGHIAACQSWPECGKP